DRGPMEVARSYRITCLPWNLLGYAVAPAGLRQVAAVTSVYGLSFLAVSAAALVAWALLERRPPRAGWALVALWAAGVVTLNFVLSPPPRAEGAVADSERSRRGEAVLIQANVPPGGAARAQW